MCGSCAANLECQGGVCVDINPAGVTKLTDRGTFQAVGLVTDVEPFLRELCSYLDLNVVCSS